MFDGPAPHVFAMPPGADFPRALAAGLRDMAAAGPPEALARVTLYLNSARMLRAVRSAFVEAG
ncbi:MAG: hypothetical protein ACK4OP_14510, partial [Gemmobacter sp.]